MFIECLRHKSKIQRNVWWCIERCPKKCENFYAIPPKKIAKLLATQPERGRGHQLEMFKQPKPKSRKSKS